jgi:hypothetical protein
MRRYGRFQGYSYLAMGAAAVLALALSRLTGTETQSATSQPERAGGESDNTTDGGRRHEEQHTSLPTYQNRAPQGGRGGDGPAGRKGSPAGRTGGRGAGPGVDGQRRIPAPTSGGSTAA